MKPGHKHLIHVAAIALVTLAAYSGSFDGDFVSDDLRRVRDNPDIRSLDGEHLRAIFTEFDGANYMPLKVLSLAVDHRLWGPGPAGYHATNLLLHVGCALLIYLILVRLGLGGAAACLTALLWAVHPLQVESVAWISERKNVLSGLFFFAAFRVYLGFSDRGGAVRYLVFVVLYVLALLSKMNTMVLPAICLAYEATFRFRLQWRHGLAALPAFALAAAAGWYNLTGNPIHATAYHGGSAVVTWLSSSVVVFRYLGHTAAPLGLMPVYDVPLRGSVFELPVLFALAGLAAAVAGTAWFVRHGHRGAFWVLWFGICLAPMLNIVPFRSLMHDRYMYLALLGPVALAATLLDALRRPALRRRVAAAASVAVLVCVGLSLRQVEIWSDPLSHWAASAGRVAFLTADPGNKPLGFDERLDWVTRAIVESPDSAILNNNLGALQFRGGDPDEALRHLERAARAAPDHPTILANLGYVSLSAERLPQARQALERATQLAPHAYVPQLFLTRFYLAAGDLEGAERGVAALARIRPHPAQAGSWSREREALERLEAAATPPR